MASDVYITPTCSASSPRWLWDGPSPRRAAGTPVINITYDTSRWIYFYLRYLMGCIPPTSMLLLIISISSFYLPTTQRTSFLPAILKRSEHHHPIHGTGRPGPGVVSIAVDTLADFQEVVMLLSFGPFLSRDNKVLSDFVRRHWVISATIKRICDRVGYIGFGSCHYFRYWLDYIYIKQLGLDYIKQLAYKKRSHLNTASYAIFGFVEVISLPCGD